MTTQHTTLLNNIVENIEKVIIGKRPVIELVLCALLSKGHVLLEDKPGVGKTSLVSAIAKSFDCSFKRIQFTPDILPSDITGFSMYNQKTNGFEYHEGAIMSQIILADEINRTSPKTQSSLLEVMEENQVTVDGITHEVPQPFVVFATQNPIEYLGTYPLPEAQLDRFFMKLSLGYPSATQESNMLSLFRQGSPIHNLEPVATSADLIKMQEAVLNIHVERTINDYIVSLVNFTREAKEVALGASPRASIALYKAGQSNAYYIGREFVTPDDIKKMAPAVLEHRLVLTQESQIRKITASAIIEEALNSIKVPV